MRHYELMVVLSPVLSQEEFAGTLERIKDVITQSGGDITQEEQWGMRRLAYPIRRAGQTYLEGNYILTRFSTDTIVPRELEPHLTLSEDVLRFLVVRSEAPKPAPPQPQEPAVVEQPESGEPASELADSPDGEAGQTAADQPTEAEAPTASLAEESASEPVLQRDGEADQTAADEPTEPEAPTTSLAEEPASELADSSDGEVGETEADEPTEAEAPTASLAEEPIVSENEASDGEESGEPQQEGPIVGQVEEPQIGEEAEEPQPAGDSASQSGQTRE
ncbi:MAG: 30S ribosomal protein S6 [Dehalococcoidia bacterium]|nr:30S ribosomal protein S6 [Dehalococcoidia bacterium]